MSIDAMKQALEALEELNKVSIGVDAVCLPGEIDTAMDALRLAIEQAETKKFPGKWIDEMAEVPPDAWPKSEALRLADALTEKEYPPRRAAAEELRRLHAENEDHIQQLRKEQLEVERMHRVNAQMMEALDYFIQCVEQSSHLDARIGFMGGAFDKARAAIAAAKEMK